MRKLLYLCVGLFTTVSLNAQRSSFERNSFWTETVLNGKIGGKFRWQFDYQYRRMSDASTVKDGSRNMFKNNFQHVYRPWIHYQLTDGVRLSLSPIGFWETYSPASENGGTKKIQPEFRICPQLTLSNKIGRVIIDQRYRYESRILGTQVNLDPNLPTGYSEGLTFPTSGHKGRMRYFVRATIPLGNHTKLENKTYYIVAWNEIFISTGANTANEKIWDQNRSFCLLGYKPEMKFPMRFELGFGLQYANRMKYKTSVDGTSATISSNLLEKNRLLQLYVIFEDFNSIFKKNKK